MKTLLASILALSLCACAVPDQSSARPLHGGIASGGGGGSCAADGSASQPSGGAKPLSALFPGTYAVTSPCAVYGVTASVGPASGSGTTDPTTFSWSAPYSYNSTDKAVRCDDNGTPPPVIDGFDFTLHGGVGFEDISCHTGATGPIVKNSKFKVTSNCSAVIYQGPTAVGLELLNNSMDGGGLTAVAACGATSDIMMNLQGSGPYVIQYNDCRFSPQHCANFNGLGGAIDFRYNLIGANGWGQGPHADDLWIATIPAGVTYSPVNLSFNTAYNPQPNVDMVETPTATFTSGSNVITTTQLPSITGANDNSLVVGSPITSTKLPAGTTIVSATTTGGPVPTAVSTSITVSQNATSSGSATFSVQNAYASNGIPLFFIVQGGGTIDSATVQYNTLFAIGGSIKTASTMIYCGPKSADGSVMTNVTWGSNYVDASGAVGVYDNSSAACHGAGNDVDMVTGGALTPPW